MSIGTKSWPTTTNEPDVSQKSKRCRLPTGIRNQPQQPRASCATSIITPRARLHQSTSTLRVRKPDTCNSSIVWPTESARQPALTQKPHRHQPHFRPPVCQHLAVYRLPRRRLRPRDCRYRSPRPPASAGIGDTPRRVPGRATRRREKPPRACGQSTARHVRILRVRNP